MPARRILQLGNRLLREISKEVADGEDTLALFQDLKDTLHDFRGSHGFGRGISAIQIGVPKRVIYMEVAGVTYSILNPEVEWMSPEKFTLWDDCFSFPNLLVRLERSQRLRMRYRDDAGAVQILEAEDALAELLQHEVDHLNGILAIDRALDRNSFATREEYLLRYAKTAR